MQHGGQLPQVRAAARRRLAAAQLEARRGEPLSAFQRQLVLGGREEGRQLRREVRALLLDLKVDLALDQREQASQQGG
jgi:hypothetical protein